MNIDQIMRPEVQEFISSNENADIQKLLLGNKSILGIPIKEIAQQIAGRKKIKEKLPSWYSANGIIYPPSIHLEQSSSEITAEYKSSLIKASLKNAPDILDLTGGYGVDSALFSSFAQQVDYVEPDEALYEIAKNNFSRLGRANVACHHQSAESFLKTIAHTFDFIFIDPSRRKDAKKVFRFQDCLPDVIRLQKQLFKGSKCIMIKASPMLDLQQGIKELGRVRDVYVVSIQNECKELLFIQDENFDHQPTIHAVDLDKTGTTTASLSFKFGDEANAQINFSDPAAYLYEPNAAILKAGAFKLVGQTHHLDKLASNTHFYTSSEVFKNFPGRIFKIISHEKLDGNLKKSFPNGYANIISRSYPLSVEAIKKKTGLKEGGSFYLICTQGETKKFSLIGERIQ